MEKIRWNILKRCPKSGKIVGIDKKSIWYRLFLPIIGLGALVWVLVRVVPKPSRAAYPCQQVAIPLASSFLVWIGAGSGILFFGKKILGFVRAHWLSSVQICLVAMVLGTQLSTSCANVSPNVITTTTTIDGYTSASPHPTATTIPGNGTTPTTIQVSLPTAVVADTNVNLYSFGTNYSKVIWGHDELATSWDGTGNWWNSINQTEVTAMLKNTLLQLTGQSTESAAWDTLFKNYQTKKGLAANGYQAGQTIAIKVNMNGVAGYNNTSNACFVSPQMSYALLKQLVDNAGVPASNIYLYDATRYIPDSIYNLCHGDSELASVHYVDFYGQNGREQVVAGPQIVWSKPADIEHPVPNPNNRGQDAYLPTVAVNATYLINFSSMKAHNLAGMTVTGKNWFGSIMSGGVGWAPDQAGIHPTVAALDYNVPGYAVYPKRPMGSYNAIVDLMANKNLGAKAFLFLADGLYAANNQNDAITTAMKWHQTVFQKSGSYWWPSSLLASQDPVAIDSVGYEMLVNEEAILSGGTLQVGNTATNYLKEAASASSPPAGTYHYYQGDGTVGNPSSGHLAPNLGTIVHWSASN